MKLALALSDTTLRRAKPRAVPYKLADGGGLFALVKPNGSILWRYKFRFDGKEKTLPLGQYPAVKLIDARKAHQAAKLKLKDGVDPAAERRATREAEATAKLSAAARAKTFGDVADDWLKTRTGGSKKTFDRDTRMIGYLKSGKGPVAGFGSTPVMDTELGHLLPLLKAVNHPTRIRLISAARNVLRFAKAHDFWPKGRALPFSDVDFSAGFAPHRERHRPALTDAKAFGILLRKIDAFEGREDNLTGYALRLLILTFVRPGTAQAAEWDDFDLARALWIIPFDRLKMATERKEAGKSEDDYVVPLSRQAVSLLRELHRITGHERFLFPGARRGRTISENTLNGALHAMGYKNVHCAHGFRSSASTLLNRERINGRRRFEPELIEMQQDRLDASTRAVYDRDDRLPERVELMQHWADKVDELRHLRPIDPTIENLLLSA